MAPPPEAHPGTRVGRYTLVREIASGGMATVYLAHVTDDDGRTRRVAIKRLHPHLATEEEFVERFFDEARLAQRIEHPNVVATLEVDDVEGLAIVMDYVEGPTLLDLSRDLSARGERVPRAVASRVVLDLLAGLQAAHELTDDEGRPLELVHRDVSPHNVLVGLDGVTRITDFGVARAAVRLSSTPDGRAQGKLAYMAPEQCASEHVDRRADVFAAGVVLWELLTGRGLFTGATDARVMHALLHADIPRVRALVPDVPEALDAVVARALARDRDARWPACADFSKALYRASSPAARPVVGALAARTFEAQRPRGEARRITLPPAPSTRAERKSREPSLDATVLDSSPPTPEMWFPSPPPAEEPRASEPAAPAAASPTPWRPLTPAPPPDADADADADRSLARSDAARRVALALGALALLAVVLLAALAASRP